MNPAPPLLDLREPSAPLFFQRGEPVSRGQFASAAAALAQRLPERPHALNLCEGRYSFAVGLAALALRGQTALLPPNNAAATLLALNEQYPGAYVLSDDASGAGRDGVTVDGTVPAGAIDSLAKPVPGRPLAVVFTSGSTGAPLPQVKTWASLHYAGRALSQHLLAAYGRCQILATVPQQHMYGLETSVLMPLCGGHAAATGRPVFPDDVRAAAAALPAPRVLVTTPVHIRALLTAGVRMPPLACLISATAPLSEDLAARAEQAFNAPVLEIYGCSEAGSIATRRTVEGEVWRPLDGMSVSQRGEQSLVHGVHLPEPIPLQDLLEPCAGGFRLLGRAGDMIKVAGKRASLADLTQKLLSIPGVVDGVVFQPEADDGSVVQRPAAVVVAPSLNEREILQALGRLIDPVFLPRPLRKIDGLPRNDVGKLPRASLQRLLAHA